MEHGSGEMTKKDAEGDTGLERFETASELKH
jgi:hypothetical protein